MSAVSVIRSMIATGVEVRKIPAKEQYILVPVAIFERLWDEVAHGQAVAREHLHKRIVTIDGARVYPCSTVPMVLSEIEATRWLVETDQDVRR